MIIKFINSFMDKWFLPLLFFSGAVAFMMLIISLPICIIDDINEKKNFMNDCIKDHKKYECTSLWKGINAHR